MNGISQSRERLKYGQHLKTIAIVLCTLLVGGGATAGAASLMSGKKIKKNSIPLNRLTKKTQKLIKTKAKVTAQGVAAGPKGDKGDKGDKGAAGGQGPPGPSGTATYSGPNWGLIDRNVIGSPVGALRSGPFAGTAADTEPPLGDGSLGFSVKDGTEKVAFGNQVDFVDDLITDVTAVGFTVFQTGENAGINPANLPNITFEVDRNGAPLAGGEYSSLVFNPAALPPAASNKWTAIDATDDAAGTWYFSNASAGTGCTLGSPCTFTALKAAVTTNSPNMSVLTLAVAKGRDNAWNGAIDALRYNGSVYDFEPFGVITTAAP